MNDTQQLEHIIGGETALQFILAGRAVFTIRSKRTGTRFTYKVTATKEKDAFFVKFMSGPDNEASYTFAGMIFNGNRFVLGRKARANGLSETTPAIAAFIWVFAKLTMHVEPPNVEIWHSGHCGRCARTLTVPESIESGIGPECAKMMGLKAKGVAA